MIPWFIWNGVDSRDMGLVVVSYSDQIRAAERVETIEIPGRSGYLTMTEGTDVYSSVIRTIRIGNHKGVDLQHIRRWLRGSGTLVVGNEPSYSSQARIINEIDLAKLHRGVWTGDVVFQCQPLRAQYPPESHLTWDGDTDNLKIEGIYNPGDVAARPLITATFNGNPANLAFSVDGVEDVTLRFNGTVTGENLRFCFDTNAMIIFNPDTGTDYTFTLYQGDPRTLWIPTGDGHQIAWSSNVLSAVSVLPRWRWL